MKRQLLERVAPADRREWILDACRGKSVLHLGCVDHPLLAERLASGDLLHAALAPIARVLYGVDLDGDGLATLRAAGYDHLYQGNIEQLGAVALDRTFDVLLAGEIVEHLANPGQFLRAAPRLLAPGGKLVITVPSAQSLRLALNAMRHREIVHPDHVAYYSPSTLTHLLEAHGYDIDELRPYWSPARSSGPLGFRLYDQSVRLMRKVSPWLGEGLLVTAHVRA